MNNFKYIDIDYLTDDYQKDLIINKYFDTSINLKEYQNCSLVKLDLTTDIPLFRILLKQYNDEKPIEEYATLYDILYTYYSESEEQYKDILINVKFKNHHSTENPNVSVSNNKYIVDNFSDYFKLYSIEPLNECLNQNIKDFFSKYIDNLSIYENILPYFYSLNDVLYINLPTTTTSDVYQFYKNREELIKSNNKKGFTLAFNYNLYSIYYKIFNCSVYKYNNKEYYYIDLNFNGSTTKINVNNVDYFIETFKNTSYFEYCSDIRGLIITTSLKLNSIIKNEKKQNYIIETKEANINLSGINIFVRLGIDHDREHITRLIYSNDNITNNTCQLINQNDIQNITFILYYIDKYGYTYRLNLNQYDSVYIQLCLF